MVALNALKEFLPWSYATKSGVFSLQFSDCKLESSNAAII
jgi:hypothetical protein